jgi:hypothetical protein
LEGIAAHVAYRSVWWDATSTDLNAGGNCDGRYPNLRSLSIRSMSMLCRWGYNAKHARGALSRAALMAEYGL